MELVTAVAVGFLGLAACAGSLVAYLALRNTSRELSRMADRLCADSPDELVELRRFENAVAAARMGAPVGSRYVHSDTDAATARGDLTP